MTQGRAQNSAPSASQPGHDPRVVDDQSTLGPRQRLGTGISRRRDPHGASLKGVAGTLGATALERAAAKLEKILQSSTDATADASADIAVVAELDQQARRAIEDLLAKR